MLTNTNSQERLVADLHRSRSLPDVSAENGRSLAYRNNMVKILKKSEEEEANKAKNTAALEEIEGLLKSLREYHTKPSEPTGRQCLLS